MIFLVIIIARFLSLPLHYEVNMVEETVIIPDKPFEYLGIDRDTDKWRL